MKLLHLKQPAALADSGSETGDGGRLLAALVSGQLTVESVQTPVEPIASIPSGPDLGSDNDDDDDDDSDEPTALEAAAALVSYHQDTGEHVSLPSCVNDWVWS
jgi:hypothetical protein